MFKANMLQTSLQMNVLFSVKETLTRQVDLSELIFWKILPVGNKNNELLKHQEGLQSSVKQNAW